MNHLPLLHRRRTSPLTTLIALATTPFSFSAGMIGLDLDGDGMSDAWELIHGASSLLPNHDQDGDGKSNLEESFAGTNPFSAASCLQIASLQRMTGPDRLVATWDTVNGKLYQLQTSNDLHSWNDTGAPVSNSSGLVALAIDLSPPSPSRLFCRVVVSDPDQDGDGLTSYEEHLLGYSDADPNSNGTTSGGDFPQAVSLLTGPGSFQLGGQAVTGLLPSLPDASRFLSQATMGADYEAIQGLSTTGFAAWLDNQFAQPVGSHVAKNVSLLFSLPDLPEEPFSPYRWTWWDLAMKSPDVLRQRFAFALSEILVVSDVLDLFEDHPWGIAGYYDVLVDGAFGNYRDLLYKVSTHPVMGHYLSHAKNRPTDLATNRFPDENYAREVMQLFSIGLFELNQDGSRKKDAGGNDIPTYDNGDITEFARIFTGLTFDPSPPGNGIPHFEDEFGSTTITNETEYIQVEPVFLNRPMLFFDPMHETGSKSLLNGFVTNPGNNTQQDLNAAIDNLFNHPNVGPFIGRLLIQRLVTSNPSPGYISRVAAAFNNNGSGVRGDMKSVIRAILLDPEARNGGFRNDPTYGKLREPVLRHTQLCRAFNLTTASGNFRNMGISAGEAFKQLPMHSPSVFNFYLPDHRPLGPIADANLVAPEFQITTATTTIATMNFWTLASRDGGMDFDDPIDTAQFDFTDEIALTNDIPALVVRLDLLLTRGALSPAARTVITDALLSASAHVGGQDLVEFAIYLFLCSPDFAVLR